ncbi:SDR family oxidoreductase [Jiulongibacter sp. NS-SX5]|uniref:SDR family oxidoreductase n=1 Tax=Jiulongibacter sp. NS-SX5 TaxID=3463854 RepID=UPI00405A454E
MILITGATGGLGSKVVSFLKGKTDEEIAVMVRDKSSEKAQKYAADGFTVREADYENSEALEKAFDGVNLLYFVSGSDIMNREPQHKNVVEAAKKAGVNHVFYTSVSINGLTEESPLYNAMNTHALTEQWLRDSGVNYTFLRHNLYADVIPMFAGQKEALKAGKTVLFPAGKGKTAFITKANLAEAGANALLQPKAKLNGAYELNGTQNIDFDQVSSYLSEVFGEKINYVSPDAEQFQKTLSGFGVPPEAIGISLAFGKGTEDGLFEAAETDIVDLLGREPDSVQSYLSQAYA